MNAHQKSIPVEDLVGPPITKDYAPNAFFSHHGGMLQHRKPLFGLRWVHEMLRDPRVRFGLWLIKGPIISNARFLIKTDNPQIKEFLINTITRFWRNSASRALRAIEWGVAPAEVLYRIQNNQVVFDNLKDIHPLDTRVVTHEGKKVGITIKRGKGSFDDQHVYIGGPKSFWHIQGRDQQPWYGTSRLVGAFHPWLELHDTAGAYDIRRLYYHKYAFRGERIRFPPGETIDQNGRVVPNNQLASEIVEKLRTGHVIALPNTLDETNSNYAWQIEDPSVEASPTNVLEYIADLRNEIWEGMGIPGEIVSAEGTGAFAGRRVPQQAFYALLQEMLLSLISDADEQIFRPLIHINFGIAESDHEIIPFPLLKEVEDNDEQDPMQQEPQVGALQQPGQPQNPQPPTQAFATQPNPILTLPDSGLWVGNGMGQPRIQSNGQATQTQHPIIYRGNGWAQVEPAASH